VSGPTARDGDDGALPAGHIFVRGLRMNAANHVPLTPISFLERSADVYPDKVAVRHGRLAYTYREFAARCRRLASALARRGVLRGDTVAVMAPNVPALLEAHYAVPALGACVERLERAPRCDIDRVLSRSQRSESVDHGL
jgi:fatty-acyl-CoA synthase